MRLLPLQPDVCARLAAGDWDALPPGLGLDAVADHLRVLATTCVGLYGRHGAQWPWLVYLAVDPGRGVAVGSCGFRGPCREGVVEVASFTFPPYLGCGYGARMTAALVELARSYPQVKTLRHHTPSAEGAAARILDRFGFQCEGLVDDPKEGRVWRWTLPLGS